jgi:polysaccharide biosynthesis transport protein
VTAAFPPNDERGAAPSGPDRQTVQLWSLLVRNRLLVAAATVITPVLAYLVSGFVTPVYESSASLAVEKQKLAMPSLSDGAMQGEKLDVAAEMELLSSRSLAERAADSLALHVQVWQPVQWWTGGRLVTLPRTVSHDEVFTTIRVQRNAPTTTYVVEAAGDSLRITTEGQSASVSAVVGTPVVIGGVEITFAPGARTIGRFQIGVSTFSDAVGALRGSLDVRRPSRDANSLVVAFQSPDPAMARQVPNVLATTFIAVRREILKTEARSTVRFLRGQLDSLQLQLGVAERRLSDFRARNGVVDVGTQATSQVGATGKLREDRVGKQAEARALRATLAELASARRTAGRDSSEASYWRLVAFPGIAASTQSRLQTLSEERSRRDSLLLRRTATDEAVVQVNRQIANIERDVLEAARSYLAGLESQIRFLDSTITTSDRSLGDLPATERELGELQRQAKVLADLYTAVQSRLKEAEIAQAVDDSRLRMLDSAETPGSPIKPNRSQFLRVGLFVGLLLGVVLAFLREFFDQTVHTQDDMQAAIGAPALGLIPHIRSTQVSGLARLTDRLSIRGGGREAGEAAIVRDPASPIAEAYRALRTNVTFIRPDAAPKVLVFTSPSPRDGKTTTAANFAMVLAYQKGKVLLIDADMRRGALHEVFGVPREPGLANLLVGGTRAADAIRSVDLGQHGTLDVLPVGAYPPNPAELLGSSRLDQLLAEFSKWYDYVIVDSPPLGLVTDAAVLGTKADGVVLVGRANHTVRASLNVAADQLRAVRAPVLGYVLNDYVPRRDYRTPSGYGDYYGYYGYGRSGGDDGPPGGPSGPATSPGSGDGRWRVVR